MSPAERKFPRGEAFADDAEHHGWDQETGMPTVAHASDALQVWAILQNRGGSGGVTVREAGDAFNLDDDQVRELVNGHPWMYLSGPDDDATKQIIEHDGE